MIFLRQKCVSQWPWVLSVVGFLSYDQFAITPLGRQDAFSCKEQSNQEMRSVNKDSQVHVTEVSIFAVTKLGMLRGSFHVSGWIEILNLFKALECTGKLRFF